MKNLPFLDAIAYPCTYPGQVGRAGNVFSYCIYRASKAQRIIIINNILLLIIPPPLLQPSKRPPVAASSPAPLPSPIKKKWPIKKKPLPSPSPSGLHNQHQFEIIIFTRGRDAGRVLEPRGFAHRSEARKWFRQSYGTHVLPSHYQLFCIFEMFGKHCSKIMSCTFTISKNIYFKVQILQYKFLD